MARPTVEYPCGCVVNDSHVVAMCVRHDQELRDKAKGERKVMDDRHAELRRTIDGLGK